MLFRSRSVMEAVIVPGRNPAPCTNRASPGIKASPGVTASIMAWVSRGGGAGQSPAIVSGATRRRGINLFMVLPGFLLLAFTAICSQIGRHGRHRVGVETATPGAVDLIGRRLRLLEHPVPQETTALAVVGVADFPTYHCLASSIT